MHQPDSTAATGGPILVTGGNGALGRHVVARLRDAGREVRVLSRNGGPASPGVSQAIADLHTGEGVDAAVAGAPVIVHCAGSRTGDEEKARTLVAAARRAGTRHLVYISVVGDELVPQVGRADRSMFGYFGAKLAASRVIAASGVPFTTLHATQFHELTLMTVSALAKLPIVPAFAGFRFQPAAADDVAARLVELALGDPQGAVADLGGPTIYAFKDLVRSYLRATGKHRLIVSMPVPGQAAAAIRRGVHLAPDHATGSETWEQFLAANLGPNGHGRLVTT
jgi:uncharacterized protein YbjT (DUF2867 family)